MDNDSKIVCPKCGCPETQLLTNYKDIGEVVGSGVGLTLGIVGATREGAKAGAVVGSKLGKFIPGVGVCGGTVIGFCGGAISGMISGFAIGSAAGECCDRFIIAEYECTNEKCGAVFKHEHKQELEAI